MPPFGRSEWCEEDFQLLRSGAIHLFWQRAILDETVSKLREAGYTVIARCLRPNRSVRSAHVDRDLCRELAARNAGRSPDGSSKLTIREWSFPRSVRRPSSGTAKEWSEKNRGLW